MQTNLNNETHFVNNSDLIKILQKTIYCQRKYSEFKTAVYIANILGN